MNLDARMFATAVSVVLALLFTVAGLHLRHLTTRPAPDPKPRRDDV